MTVRTDTGDPGENVRRQWEQERRLRQNRRRPATVLSEEAAVQTPAVSGGPDPNTEGQPVRTEQPQEVVEPAEDAQEPEDDDQGAEDAQDGQEAPEEAEPEPIVVERPTNTFGGLDEWRAYRLANGYTEAELEGLGRNAVRDLDDR